MSVRMKPPPAGAWLRQPSKVWLVEAEALLLCDAVGELCGAEVSGGIVLCGRSGSGACCC